MDGHTTFEPSVLLCLIGLAEILLSRTKLPLPISSSSSSSPSSTSPALTRTRSAGASLSCSRSDMRAQNTGMQTCVGFRDSAWSLGCWASGVFRELRHRKWRVVEIGWDSGSRGQHLKGLGFRVRKFRKDGVSTRWRWIASSVQKWFVFHFWVLDSGGGVSGIPFQSPFRVLEAQGFRV
jgi:hypothetical protein